MQPKQIDKKLADGILTKICKDLGWTFREKDDNHHMAFDLRREYEILDKTGRGMADVNITLKGSRVDSIVYNDHVNLGDPRFIAKMRARIIKHDDLMESWGDVVANFKQNN